MSDRELERQLKAANEETLRCRLETRQAKETAARLFDKNEYLAQQLDEADEAAAEGATRSAAAEARLVPYASQAMALQGLCQRLHRNVVSRLERLSELQRQASAGVHDERAAQDAENVAYVMVRGWWAVEDEWNQVTGRGRFGERELEAPQSHDQRLLQHEHERESH